MQDKKIPEIQLSVIIKTLNEERNIARCIEAAIAATRKLNVEIIVADSGSSDRTIEIATQYPVIAAQLSDFSERSCGIGPQLGYQHSKGDFVLILDADMVLHEEFIDAALARMKAENRCAGVGGQLVEKSGTGYEYDLRNAMDVEADVNVRWLDGGGLYRRTAIEDVGYLSNRNLHAYEEKELGLRLTSKGWHMFRLGIVAVDHYGHAVDTVGLLWRRWKSGYADACGESLRVSFGKNYFWEMLKVHKAIAVCLFLQIASLIAAALTSISSWPLLLTLLVWFMFFIIQSTRKKSMKVAIHSLVHLNVFAIGMAKGLIKGQVDPQSTIRSTVTHSNQN